MRSNRPLTLLVVLVVLFSICVPQQVSAAARFFVKWDAAGLNNGSSWENAFVSLQSALLVAEPNDEVWVAAGTYYPATGAEPTPRAISFELEAGVSIYGGFAGEEAQLAQRDWQAHPTVLSGDIGASGNPADNSYHVVRGLNQLVSPVRLDGFTIRDGRADLDIGEDATGGGLMVVRVSGTLENLVFENNYALRKGGGLSLAYSTMTLNNLSVHNNTSAGVGGGLHEANSTLLVNDSTFQSNTAIDGGGGLILAGSSSIYTGNAVSNNIASNGNGGGIQTFAGNPQIRSGIFVGNTASISGGGIYVAPTSTASFADLVIVGNTAQNGGGVYSYENAATFRVLQISGNLAHDGAGFYVYSGSPILDRIVMAGNVSSHFGGGLAVSQGAAVMATNLVIHNNSADLCGGAIWQAYDSAALHLVNSTLVENILELGPLGGALCITTGTSFTGTNLVIWGNSDEVISNDGSATISLTYSNIQGGYTGTGNISSAPQFVDPDGIDGLPGTLDDNFALTSASPGIDAGQNSAVPGSITSDAAGSPRFANMLHVPDSGSGTAPVVDMGAYEVQNPNLLVVKSVTPTTVNEGQLTAYTIQVSNTGLGTAHNVVISDGLPPGLIRTSLPVLVPPNAGTPGTAPVLFENITLLPGEAVSVTFNATPQDGLVVMHNVASATAFEVPDPIYGSDNLTVNDVPPQVIAGLDQTINEGSTANFLGSYSDPAGSFDAPYLVSWLFGAEPPVTGTLNPSRMYPQSGVFPVTLTVTDADGVSGQDDLTVTVNNVAPSVNAGVDINTNEGQLVMFIGSFSDPAGGLDAPYTYAWDFGDGSPVSNSLSTIHTYIENGSYIATLHVTDKDGAHSADSLTVTVNNLPPVVNAGNNQSVLENDLVSFAGTASDPGVTDTLTYTWSFGDGSDPVTGTLTPNHNYGDADATPDVYTVTLTVRDDEGAETSDTLTVTVSNMIPAVNAGSNMLSLEGEEVLFNGAYTDSGGTGDAPYTVAWDFGDGTTASGTLTPGHHFLDNGSYVVTLSVTDKDGQTGTDTLVVTVNNIAPTVDAGRDLALPLGQIAEFQGSYDDPAFALDEPYQISWDFGDGTPPVTGTLTPTHLYTARGFYTVTLTVTDKDGGVGTDTAHISVNYITFIPMTH